MEAGSTMNQNEGYAQVTNKPHPTTSWIKKKKKEGWQIKTLWSLHKHLLFNLHVSNRIKKNFFFLFQVPFTKSVLKSIYKLSINFSQTIDLISEW